MSATSSHGTILKLKIGTEFIKIPGVGDIGFSPGQRGEIDVTSHDSKDQREIIPGLKGPDEITFPVSWDPIEKTHKALKAAYETAQESTFHIIFPGYELEVHELKGYVMSISKALAIESQITAELSVKGSLNLLTLTPEKK